MCVLFNTYFLYCDSVKCDSSNVQIFSPDFSALRQLKQLYVDGNCGLHCLPVSLVHAGVTLGVHECGMWTEEGEEGVACRQGCPPVLPLLELAARAVHRYLKGPSLASNPAVSFKIFLAAWTKSGMESLGSRLVIHLYSLTSQMLSSPCKVTFVPYWASLPVWGHGWSPRGDAVKEHVQRRTSSISVHTICQPSCMAPWPRWKWHPPTHT